MLETRVVKSERLSNFSLSSSETWTLVSAICLMIFVPEMLVYYSNTIVKSGDILFCVTGF
jgi:hypothetical protein